MAEETPIGMSAPEARRRLVALSDKRTRVVDRMREMNVNPMGDGIPPEYIRLQNELVATDRTIDETREWYSVRVLESLDASSRRLSKLTWALILLTGILAVVAFLQVLRV